MIDMALLLYSAASKAEPPHQDQITSLPRSFSGPSIEHCRTSAGGEGEALQTHEDCVPLISTSLTEDKTQTQWELPFRAHTAQMSFWPTCSPSHCLLALRAFHRQASWEKFSTKTFRDPTLVSPVLPSPAWLSCTT